MNRKAEDFFVITIIHNESERLLGVSWEDAYLYEFTPDTENNEVKERIALLNETESKAAFSSISEYEDCLVFTPAKNNKIAIYNRNTGCVDTYKIPDYDKRIGETDLVFSFGYIYRDYLYMFGNHYPGILRFDLRTKEFLVNDEFLENLKITCAQEGCFPARYFALGDKIYIPFMNTNAVMELHLDSEDYVIHYVGDTIQRYVSIEWDDTYFWLIPRDGKTGSIVRWNPENGEVEQFRDYPEDFGYHPYSFLKSLCINDEIFAFAHSGNMSIKINTKTGKIERMEELYDIAESRGCKYLAVERIGETVVFVTMGKWGIWNLKDGSKQVFPYHLNANTFSRYEKKRVGKLFDKNNKNIMLENEQRGLQEYLSFVEYIAGE